MRVLLLNPPRVKGLSVVREERYEHRDIGACYPPLSLLNTASVLKNQGHIVKLIDANGFNLTKKSSAILAKEFAPDLVIARLGFDTLDEDLDFTVSLSSWLGAKLAVRSRIAADYEPLARKIIATPGVTVLFKGPPEVLALEFIQKLEQNQTFDPLFKGGQDDLKKMSLISPDYSFLPSLDPYYSGVAPSGFALLSTSFGCPFKCSFCAYQGSRAVFRNPVEVVDDLEELIKNFKVTHLLLFDDLFMMKPDNVETFCREIIRRRLKIKWIACTRADFLLPGLLPLMKRSGLIEMALGIESGSPAVLEATGKGISLEDIRKSAGILHSNDVLFYAMAIAGLPGETEKTLMETVDFLIEIDPFYAQFCLAVPFPNTPLFDWYDSRGYILTKDWSKYWPLSEEPVVRTEALTGPQLKNLRKKAYRRFVMRPGYLLRKINFRDPVWTFWAGWSLAARMARLLTGGPVR